MCASLRPTSASFNIQWQNKDLKLFGWTKSADHMLVSHLNLTTLGLPS